MFGNINFVILIRYDGEMLSSQWKWSHFLFMCVCIHFTAALEKVFVLLI